MLVGIKAAWILRDFAEPPFNVGRDVPLAGLHTVHMRHFRSIRFGSDVGQRDELVHGHSVVGTCVAYCLISG